MLAQWGANPIAGAIAQTLHKGAWFHAPGAPSVITSKTGGRQGRKLEGAAFDSAYSIALDIRAWELASENIAFRVCVPLGAFWG